MTIVYPLSLPVLPCPSRVTVIGTSQTAVTESPFTGKAQVQRSSNQAWRMQVEYPSMTKAQARQWMATLLALEGRAGTILFGDPAWIAPAGNWAGAPKVNGVGQTGNTLALNGFTAGATIKAGDCFQISAGEFSRLHMALTDATADGSGLATLDIWPRHRSSPGAGDAITTARPKGVFRLAADDVSRTWERIVYGISLELVEAIQ